MSNEAPEIIFIRRSLRIRHEAPHGGVWKIAFADFMTAMMAFFLVMWLISATDQKTRETVANYFNPVKLASATVDRKGLRDPQQVDKDHKPEATEPGPTPDNLPPTQGGASRISDHRQSNHERQPRFSEAALFEDPYAVLAALVAGSEPGQAADNVGAFETRGQSGEPGLNGGEAQRDPFDPVYWKMARAPAAQDGKAVGGARLTSPGTASGGASAEAALQTTTTTEGGTKPAAATASDDGKKAPEAVAARAAEAEKPGIVAEPNPAASPAPAAAATANHADAASQPPRKEIAANGAETTAAEARPQTSNAAQGQAETGDLIRRIEAAVAPINPAPGVQVAQTGEGLLVTLMDSANFGMFAIGSAEPRPELIRAIDAIGKVVAGQKGKIVVRGHTDGRPFRSRDYDNWRLSTARAHMAFHMLVRGGVAPERFERIEGYADHQLKRGDDPSAPENRRIEILIRRPAA